MINLGDFAAGKTVRVKWNTSDPTGAPITLAGTPVAKVYKDGSTTTETTTGVTLTVDFDGVTGLHDVAVDLSADATFYASGSDFAVVLTAGTVNGISVAGLVLGQFSISNRTTVDIRRKVAVANFTFYMTDAATHLAKTGLVDGDFTLKKGRLDSGAAASLSGSITEVDSTNLPGIYQVSLTAAELDGKVATLFFRATGADDRAVTVITSD